MRRRLSNGFTFVCADLSRTLLIYSTQLLLKVFRACSCIFSTVNWPLGHEWLNAEMKVHVAGGVSLAHLDHLSRIVSS